MLDTNIPMSLIILCLYIYISSFCTIWRVYFTSPATHLALADYTTKLYYVRLISFNMRGWFNANFIYATKSRREVGCKNVEGTPVLFRERALPNFLSLSFSLLLLFILSFLPSFLPFAIWKPCGVYFLWLLHAHSIILYSFLHFTADLFYFPNLLSPNIPCLCHITRRACKFNSPAFLPSLTITFFVLLLPFLPVWNPNSWRLVVEGTVPCLSHREIHSRAQLMPSESKSYFVHSHSNFRRVFHYLSLFLLVFSSVYFFFFPPHSLLFSLHACTKGNHKWIRNMSLYGRDRNQSNCFSHAAFYSRAHTNILFFLFSGDICANRKLQSVKSRLLYIMHSRNEDYQNQSKHLCVPRLYNDI